MKKPSKPMIDKDGEIRPLTRADMKLFRPPQEVLPKELFDLMVAHTRGRPKKTDPKKQITLRLDADVVDHFRNSGAGWQTRINDVLRNAIK